MNYPDNPEWVYNIVSGTARSIYEPAYTMLNPSSGTRALAMVLLDSHRQLAFEDRGECLHLNPTNVAQAKVMGDPLESIDMWSIARSPNKWEQYGIEPAGEIPYNEKWTPVDLLMGGLRHSLLHNVSYIMFFPINLLLLSHLLFLLILLVVPYKAIWIIISWNWYCYYWLETCYIRPIKSRSCYGKSSRYVIIVLILRRL